MAEYSISWYGERNIHNKCEFIDCVRRVLATVTSTIAQNPQTSKACLVFEHLDEHGKWEQWVRIVEGGKTWNPRANTAYDRDMRMWASKIWEGSVWTASVDVACVNQGVSKTTLQQMRIRRCMHWFVSRLFCEEIKQNASRFMAMWTNLLDAS